MEIFMSTLLQAQAPGVPASVVVLSWGRGLGAWLGKWWVSYITWRVQRLAIRQLASMSDRELRDIGIARSEIAVAVTHGGPRHPLVVHTF
jgi:uncharacterized protein YjiS (DUF1127 family)